MRGKYSPTVTAAYIKDQNWHQKYRESWPMEAPVYDPEGFDSYGYDKNDVDRAGNEEYEYYSCDDDHGSNSKYYSASATWGFDGVKPVRAGIDHQFAVIDLVP